jgi:poly-gamma-glutamate synthesis protein (capsule biosynthesis protein)
MDLALFLAGDAMITRPWSQVRDPAFERLVAEMRGADVSIVNLETVIHEFDGHPQADSGGVYMSAPPAIAAELKWAGVDMVAHANNHAFDYGSIGLLETLQHAEAAGLLLAGAGPDLQRARAPRYFACNGGAVGLVAMTASYVGYGRASRSRSDLHGRPGVNPLELTRSKLVEVSPRMASWLRRIARLRGKPASAVSGTSFRLFGRRFQVAERSRLVSGRRATAADASANLGAVSESAGRADLTVASIHAHLQGSWLRRYSHALLAAGADVVFCHGPHACRGIELVGGRPIFYGLGDFVFQLEGITRFPSEAYEKLGLGDQATPADLLRASRQPGVPMAERESYEGCAALLRFRKGVLAELRLLPLDLQFDAAGEGRGRPRWADPGLGRRIIERIAGQSRRHGTQIDFDPDRCEGRVELSPGPLESAG